MRRKDKEVKDAKIIEELLTTAQICRIAMVDDGDPYLVPLNFGYYDNALYIHSAAEGRKIDILRRNNRVCFEIESAHQITRHPEACHWSIKARSLIGYGRVEIITDFEEKRKGLDILMAQHGKQGENAYSEKQVEAIVILKITIESISCKQLGDWGKDDPST